MWSPVIDRLAVRHEVFAVDMPGFGGSPSLPDGIEPSAANLARAVLDFFDGLGIGGDPHFAGISLGGWVSIEAARARRASSVTGLCTAGFWLKPLEPKRNYARAAARALSPIVPVLTRTEGGRRRALAGQMRHPERLSGAEAAAIIRGYGRAAGYPEASRLMRSNLVGEIADLRVPLTLAWAEYDTLVRRTPLKALPDSIRQIVLPDCGHVPTWDAPDLVAETILETTRAAVTTG
jgi:pimeloyl-ACP methyl ester carboxylesterase